MNKLISDEQRREIRQALIHEDWEEMDRAISILDSLPLAPEPVKEVLMKMLREIYQAGVNDCITRERVPYLLGEIVAAYHFQVKE